MPWIDCESGQWVEGPCHVQVPILSGWGSAVLSLLLIGASLRFIRRRRRVRS